MAVQLITCLLLAVSKKPDSRTRCLEVTLVCEHANEGSVNLIRSIYSQLTYDGKPYTAKAQTKLGRIGLASRRNLGCSPAAWLCRTAQVRFSPLPESQTYFYFNLRRQGDPGLFMSYLVSSRVESLS